MEQLPAVCVVDENGMLEQIHETTGISIQADGVHCDSEAVQKWITPDSNVSMNMWAGYPDFIQVLDERFAEFLKDEAGDPLKKEYLLPNIVGDLLKEGNVDVKVLETHDKWIGITYKEDTELAQAGFKKMTEDGVYPEKIVELKNRRGKKTMSELKQLEMQKDDEMEIDLGEIFHLLMNKLWIIVLCFIIGATLAFGGTKLLITPKYSASSMIYILTKTTSVTSLADIQMGTQLTADFEILATSRPVLEEVIEKLNLDYTYEELKV